MLQQINITSAKAEIPISQSQKLNCNWLRDRKYRQVKGWKTRVGCSHIYSYLVTQREWLNGHVCTKGVSFFFFPTSYDIHICLHLQPYLMICILNCSLHIGVQHLGYYTGLIQMLISSKQKAWFSKCSVTTGQLKAHLSLFSHPNW